MGYRRQELPERLDKDKRFQVDMWELPIQGGDFLWSKGRRTLAKRKRLPAAR
jgi:hypothetical protein